MGTKNNPGTFDCYANADPDEPMFVLLARDPTAHLVVTFWRALRAEMGETSEAKLEEARECSLAMERWAKDHGKHSPAALEAMRRVLARSAPSLEKAEER